MTEDNREPNQDRADIHAPQAGQATSAAAKPSSEVWQRGPVPGFAPPLQPIVHALLQVSEEIERHAASLTPDELWARPFGVASVGFHLLHLAGSTDRLLTYARGEALTPEQVAMMRAEADALADISAAELVTRTQRALSSSLEHVRATNPDTFNDVRHIGRARMETTVGGLLFHAAEHASRHAGQLVTTVKVVKGMSERHEGEASAGGSSTSGSSA